MKSVQCLSRLLVASIVVIGGLGCLAGCQGPQSTFASPPEGDDSDTIIVGDESTGDTGDLNDDGVTVALDDDDLLDPASFDGEPLDPAGVGDSDSIESNALTECPFQFTAVRENSAGSRSLTGAPGLRVTASVIGDFADVPTNLVMMWVFDGVADEGPLATHFERAHVFNNSGTHTIELRVRQPENTQTFTCTEGETGEDLIRVLISGPPDAAPPSGGGGGGGTTPPPPPPPPPPPGPECQTDNDCNDGLFCNGLEECDSGQCVNGAVPCLGKICVEATDSCAGCLTNANCNDGNSCTSDVCSGGACSNPPRATGTACGDATVAACNAADSCDGNGTCRANWTLNGFPCSDSQFCNGVERCQNGVCAAGAPPCVGPAACNEFTDVCGCALNSDCDDGNACTNNLCIANVCSHPALPAGTGCGDTSNTTCDNPDSCDGAGNCESNNELDGTACPDVLFCNGQESCQSGLCAAGTSPCGASQFCDEPTDACIGAHTLLGVIFRGDGTTPAGGRPIVVEAFAAAAPGTVIATAIPTNGAYMLMVPPGFTGTIAPRGDNAAFAPASRAYLNVITDAANQNFTAAYTYYVDRDGVGGAIGSNGGNGTAAAPRATIQSAADSTYPGDTVIVRNGIYASESASQSTAALYMPTTRSGTAVRAVTVRGQTGETPIIDGTARGSDTREAVIIEASYVVFENFEIRNARRAAVVAVAPASFVTIRLIEAHHNDRDNTFIGGAIKGDGTVRNIIIEDCVAHHNVAGYEFREVPTRTSGEAHVPPIAGNDGFAADLPESQWNAWQGWTQYASRYCTVRRCIAYDNRTIAEHSDGFKNRYGVENTFEDNIAFGNSDDGIDGVGATRCIYRRNIAFNQNTPLTAPNGDGDGNGIKIGVRGGLDNLFAYNISFNNNRAGIDGADTERPIFYNNTVYDNEWFGIWLEGSRATVGGARFLNNVGKDNAQTGTQGDIGVLGNTNVIQFDYNCVFDDNGHNWGEGPGANGLVSTNPLFNNETLVVNTNFTAGLTIPQKVAFIRDQVLQKFALKPASPLIDAGAVISGVTDGFLGADPDMGAVESD
ncbi:MAG: right-handed parallel beta-helix repeat-containing protein [Phycisphaerales bacterium]|nr:right-handed parallel beta-helix repeat-containing protein [Phycisphaerales bacterium]